VKTDLARCLCHGNDKTGAINLVAKTLAVDFFIISEQQQVVGQTI